MKKLYRCNRCGAPAMLDFEGQPDAYVEAITMCANRHCGGTLVVAVAERKKKGLELRV